MQTLPDALAFTAFERVVVFFSRVMLDRFMASPMVRAIAYNCLDKAGYAACIMTASRAHNAHHKIMGGCPVFVLDATRYTTGKNATELVACVVAMRENVMATIRGRVVVVFPPFWPDSPARCETLDMVYVHQGQPEKLAKALGYGAVPDAIYSIMSGICRLCCQQLPKDTKDVHVLACASTHQTCRACFCQHAPKYCPYPECLMHAVPIQDMLTEPDVTSQRTLSDMDIMAAFDDADDFWVDTELDMLLQTVSVADSMAPALKKQKTLPLIDDALQSARTLSSIYT